MKEKNFQTKFSHWLKNVYKRTGAFELKQTKTNSLPFNAVVEHQREALLAVRTSTLVYKIPDVGFQNPFDCVSLTQQPAYVVIKYPKGVAIIPIGIFIMEEARSKRKSLTWERAKQLSTIEFDSIMRKE